MQDEQDVEVDELERTEAALRKWLVQQSGWVSAGIAVAKLTDMGLGLVATLPLKKDEVVLRVPLTALVNVEHAAVDDAMGELVEASDWWPDSDVVATFLLHEMDKGDESHWAPYLAMLPQAEDMTLPLLDDLDHVRAQLQNSSLVYELERIRTQMTRMHERVSELPGFFPAVFKSPAEFSLERYALAIAWVHSRVFVVPVRDGEGKWHRTKCMVPFADLVNTALRTQDTNLRCTTEGRAFECSVTRAVTRGEQILGEYSASGGVNDLPNQRVLLDYGFTFENNPFDTLAIVFPPLEQPAEWHDQLTDLLAQKGVRHQALAQSLVLQCSAEHSLPTENQLSRIGVISRLRALHELPDRTRPPANVVTPAGDVSRKFFDYLVSPLTSSAQASTVDPEFASIETRARDVTLHQLRFQRGQYATTMEEDEEQLRSVIAPGADKPESPLLEHYVRIRMGEKRVLKCLLGMLSEVAGEEEEEEELSVRVHEDL